MIVNMNHCRKSWNTPATDSMQSPVLYVSGKQDASSYTSTVTDKITATLDDSPLHGYPSHPLIKTPK